MAFDHFATHSSLVYDVSDADCSAQNGSIHDGFFALIFLTNKT